MTENSTPRYGLAEVLQSGLPYYLEQFGSLPHDTFRVLNAIMACKTTAAGAHRNRCPHCGYSEIAYNSCRNRHCPRCQAHKAQQWSEARTNELLPIPYFHIVFTIPHELNFIALQNREYFYQLLFRAVAQTLITLGTDAKRLGCQIGFFAVLHTWTQTLMDHPHVHVVIPAGGIKSDKSGFKRSRPDYLFPVKVMSSLFRGKLLSFFRDEVRQGHILFHGSLADLQHPVRFQEMLDTLYNKNFVVYAKRPFATPAQVVEYLSRYTHRVAIGDRRIVDITDTSVTFTWRDRSDDNRIKQMTLDLAEFIRRFLMHVLPSGFVKIRYFGFMANSIRKKALTLCLDLLNTAYVDILKKNGTQHHSTNYGRCCPHCNQAQMVFDCLVLNTLTG